MIPDTGGKTELAKNDSSQLEKLLELELIQKRAAFKQASTRYGSMRTLGWFLILLIAAGLVAAFFIGFSRLSEQRAKQPERVHLVTPKP